MKSELTKADNYSLLHGSISSFFLSFVAGYLSKLSHTHIPRVHHQSAASLILSEPNSRNQNMLLSFIENKSHYNEM